MVFHHFLGALFDWFSFFVFFIFLDKEVAKVFSITLLKKRAMHDGTRVKIGLVSAAAAAAAAAAPVRIQHFSQLLNDTWVG